MRPKTYVRTYEQAPAISTDFLNPVGEGYIHRFERSAIFGDRLQDHAALSSVTGYEVLEPLRSEEVTRKGAMSMGGSSPALR